MTADTATAMPVGSVASGNLDQCPWIFQRDSPTVDDSSLLIHEALLLAFRYVDFVPVVRTTKLVGSIIGLDILNALLAARHSGFQHLLQTKIVDISRPVGIVGPRDSMQSVLTVMLERSLGHACIAQDGELIATIGLKDIVRSAASTNAETGVHVSQLANPTISLPSTATLSEMLDLMMTKRVRRVLVQGGGLWKVADDRAVVEYAFGHEGILTLRDRPDDFWNHPIGDLPLRDVSSVDGRTDVAGAWKVMYDSPAECLLVDEKILTPWDVIIRFYQSTKFATRPSFELLVAMCFKATLRGILGDSASGAVLSKLQSDFTFTANDICRRPSEISGILRRIFGASGAVVERAFLRSLYAECGMRIETYEELGDMLNYARKQFEALSS